jgi:hypothetical protein
MTEAFEFGIGNAEGGIMKHRAKSMAPIGQKQRAEAFEFGIGNAEGGIMKHRAKSMAPIGQKSEDG